MSSAIANPNSTPWMMGRGSDRWQLLPADRLTGMIVGAAGAVSAGFWLATVGRVPPGIPERIAVYAYLSWNLLRKTRQPRRRRVVYTRGEP